MTAENWALFFHLIGAFLLVGGVAIAGVGFEAARRRNAPLEIALLLGLTRIGVALVAAGSALVLAFGLWLVRLERIAYGAGWVDGALALFAATAVLGMVGGQGPKRARKLVEGGGDAEEARRMLNDPIARALNYASAVLVVAIIVLMVFKPGGPSG
jgi:uncharacterized membrane protein